MAKARLARVVEELRDLQGKVDAIDIEISTSDRTDTELSLNGVEMQRRLELRVKRTRLRTHILATVENIGETSLATIYIVSRLSVDAKTSESMHDLFL